MREIGNRKFVKYSQATAGDVLVEGIYIGNITTRFGLAYEFETEEGEILALGACGAMKYKMDYIDVGTKVKVEFRGKKVLDEGPMKGSEFNDVAVFAETTKGQKMAQVEQEEIDNGTSSVEDLY